MRTKTLLLPTLLLGILLFATLLFTSRRSPDQPLAAKEHTAHSATGLTAAQVKDLSPPKTTSATALPHSPDGGLWSAGPHIGSELLRSFPRYNHGQPLPARATRLTRVNADMLEALSAGMIVVLPLADGSTVRGEVHTAVNPRVGLRAIGGRLLAPRPGFFHLEMSEGGLHAWIGCSGAETINRIFPAVDGGHLLVEDRREVAVCLGVKREGAATSGLNDLLTGVFDGGVASPLAPAGDEWSLQSHPGATGVIYLDFNGHTVTGTLWNSEFNDGQPIVAQPYPEFTPGNAAYRPDWMRRIWDHCQEDFAPFNLNVTTSQAVFNAANPARRTRVIITTTSDWYDEEKGGLAYGDTFHAGSDTPCWVWNGDINYSLPESISHEVGHTLGLHHSSRETPNSGFVEYYEGHGIWAPIMGDSFTEQNPFTLWDNGELGSMPNLENQLAIIAAMGAGTNNCGYRTDDHGGTLPAATELTANALGVIHASGRIEKTGDVDVFRLTMPPGAFDMVVAPHSPGPNALVNVTLKSQAGATLVSDFSNHSQGGLETGGSSVQLKHTAAAAATYYLEVTNTGHASHMGDYGFSAYATLGNYQVEITEPGGDDQPPVVTLGLGDVISGSDTMFITAHITDNRGLDVSTIVPGLLTVVKGGQTWSPALEDSNLVEGLGLTYAGATYIFTPPGGYWDPVDAGTYTVSFDGQAVADLTGLKAAAVTKTFQGPTSDGWPSNVDNVSLPSPVDGTANYAFTVKFWDWDSAFQMATFGSGDILITDPDGQPLAVTLTSLTGTKLNRNVTTTWSVAAPGGTWNAANIGIYTVALKAGGVIAGGTPLLAKALGTFHHRTTLFSRNMDANPGFTLNTGWAWGTPTGEGGSGGSSGRDPKAGEDGPSVLGTNLTGNYAANIPSVRYATSPAFSTIGYQDLTLAYHRWLNTRDPVMVEYRVGVGLWKTLWSSDFVSESYWSSQFHTLPTECFHQPQVQLRWGIGPTAPLGESPASGGWNLDNIRVLAGEPFAQGRIVLHTDGRFQLTESGVSNSYRLSLDQDPGANPVTITLTPSKVGELILPATVVLNSANWIFGKTIVVSAPQNGKVDGNHDVKVAHTATSANPRYDGLIGPTLTVTIFEGGPAVILTQPVSKTAAAGTPVMLTVVPAFPASTHTYQWYSGYSGQTGRPLAGATGPSRTVVTGNATSLLWVRVTRHLSALSTLVEDSATASISPLPGYAAWKYELLAHDYTQAQLDAPGFDGGDLEGDGLTHWMEFALGGQPWTRDGTLLPRIERVPDGTYFIFRRARPEVNYTIEFTEDLLGPWTALTTNPGVVDAAIDQYVKLPANGKPTLFARLNIIP